ncbi:MAG: Hsp70 family protein, partial [Acidimicrobiales bacterium]
MSYQVGVDLGTTYTAAALHRDGRASIFPLGTRSAVIPSVVLLRADGTILTGDAADRRASSEPERIVREFKRRIGDTTPIIVGGSPYSAEALTARLLEAVLEQVVEREGGRPSRLVVTHPANWGEYKRDLLRQAIRLAGVDEEIVELLTEPEAAALSYAAQERVEPGEVVAVYDLGGGTFDAAVLRRTSAGFAIVGRPEGIERLGGIDFDAAVFAHVASVIGSALAGLDHDDPAALAAVSRLRQDCVDAKEALSSDTDATVPVLLPKLQTEVRITRSEFEGLIRPALVDSIEAIRRAVASAALTIDDVSRILLVGGSSRIPLISLLVASELGRPVAVDAHPKHAIALGAAHAAGGLLGGLGPGSTVAPGEMPPGRPTPTPPPVTPPPLAAPTPTPPPAVPGPTPEATPSSPNPVGGRLGDAGPVSTRSHRTPLPTAADGAGAPSGRTPRLPGDLGGGQPRPRRRPLPVEGRPAAPVPTAGPDRPG